MGKQVLMKYSTDDINYYPIVVEIHIASTGFAENAIVYYGTGFL